MLKQDIKIGNCSHLDSFLFDHVTNDDILIKLCLKTCIQQLTVSSYTEICDKPHT